MAKKEKEVATNQVEPDVVYEEYYRIQDNGQHMFSLEIVTLIDGKLEPKLTTNTEYTFLPITLDKLKKKIRDKMTGVA